MTESPQTFVEVIEEMAAGQVAALATTELAELIELVMALGKKGSMTVELNAEPSGDRMVILAGRVASKPPRPDPEQAVFFTDDQGGLHRNDPFQARLPLGGGGPAPLPMQAPEGVDPETGEMESPDHD